MTLTAQKELLDAQRLPVSVTAVSSEMLARAGIREVSEAALYAPNTYCSELTARRVSNARFRGMGSSPANLGVATFDVYRWGATAEHECLEHRARGHRSD